MKARSYALAMIAAAAILFAGVVGANVIIDPFAVFGTGLLPKSKNLNDRYRRFTDYRLAPQQYDGVFLSSSRGFQIPVDELSRLMKMKLANFSVVGGSLEDHLIVLDYLLADKAKRGERLKAAFLLLDVDAFRHRPLTNGSNQFLWPSVMMGQSPARFWWRNLTAIQFKVWRKALAAERANDQAAPGPMSENVPAAVLAAAIDAILPASAHAEAATKKAPPERKAQAARDLGEQINIRHHLSLLRRLVALCRAHGIKLVVALSPVHPAIVATLPPNEVAQEVKRVETSVPVWDFTDATAIPGRPEMWLDPTHFSVEVGEMMLRRMFGEPVPPEWQRFGHSS